MPMLLSVRYRNGTQLDVLSLSEAMSMLQGDEQISKVIMYHNSETFLLKRRFVDNGQFIIEIESILNEFEKFKISTWFPTGREWKSKTP